MGVIFTHITKDLKMGNKARGKPLGLPINPYKMRSRKRLRKLLKLVLLLITTLILVSVLTGCGQQGLSKPSTISCVDTTTYVDTGRKAATVIASERVCEKARLSAIR